MTSGSQPDPTTAPTPTGPRLLHSLGGVNGLFEQIRQRFGDTTGYELSIDTDYATLVARIPKTTGSRRGTATKPVSGPVRPVRPNSGDARVVDLSAFDVAAVLGVIRGAAETMGVKPTNLNRVWFTVEPADDPTAPTR